MQKGQRLPSMQIPRDLFSRDRSDDVETNIQIITPPIGARVTLRCARFEAGSEHDDLAQAVCSHLRRQHSILAVPTPGLPNELLIESQGDLPRVIIGSEFRATLIDSGSTRSLDCASNKDQLVLA